MGILLNNKKTQLILIFVSVLSSAIAFKKSKENGDLKEQLQKVVGEKYMVQEELAKVNDNYVLANNKNKKLYKKVISETNHIISLKKSVNKLDDDLKADKETLHKKADIAKKLKTKNKVLAEEISKVKELKTGSLNIAKVRKKVSGKFIKTTNIKKTDGFKINFQIQQNNLAEAGEKQIHIQLINPDRQVMAYKKEANVNGKIISCSDEFLIDYNNELLDVVSLIEVNRGDLMVGEYQVKAYINGQFVANTDFTLK